EVAILDASVFIGEQPTITADVYFRRSGLQTFFAVRDFAVTIGGQVVGGGEGAFLMLSTGVAGIVSGSVQASGGGVAGSASGTLRINTTGTAQSVDFTFGDTQFQFDLPAGTDGLFFQLTVTDVSINLGGFVTVEIGEGSFDTTSGVVSDVRIFLGSGPAFFDNGTADEADDEENPAARGVLIEDAYGYWEEVGTGVFLYVEGSIRLINIAGLTLSGTARVELNTSTGEVTRTVQVRVNNLPVSKSITLGADTTKIAIDDLTIGVGGQQLTEADLAFSRDAERIVLSIRNAKLNFASGAFKLQQIDGDLLVASAGIAGRLSAALDTSGTAPLSFTGGTFSVAFNTGAAAVDTTIEVGGVESSFELPGGPYLRVELRRTVATTPVKLVVLGQAIEGEFALESATGTSGSILRIAATNVALRFTTGTTTTTDVFTLTNGEGFVVVNSTGVGASIRGTAALNVPGVSVSADLHILVNTSTTTAIDETFSVGTRTIRVLVDSGPYVKVTGTNVTLSVAGQSLRGDISFEQAAGTTTITLENTTLELGDGGATFLTATILEGQFTISTTAGVTNVTGNIAASLDVDVPNVDLHADLIEVTVDSAAGLLEIAVGETGDPATLTVLGQRISAVVRARSTTSATGERHVLLAISEASVDFNTEPDGSGDSLLSFSNGSGIVSIRSTGTAGRISLEDVTAGLTELTLVADLFEVEFNTDAAAVNASFGGQSIGVPGGPYVQVRVLGLELAIAGVITLGADVVIRQDVDTLDIAATNVSAVIGDPDGVYLALRSGTANLAITATGVSGDASGIVELVGIPGVTFEATMAVTFTEAGDVTIEADDVTIAIGATSDGGGSALPAVQITGDFTFVSTPAATGTDPILAIDIDEASASFGVPNVLSFALTDIDVTFEAYSDTTFAFIASGKVAVTGGGFELSGDLDLRVSTSAADVTIDALPVDAGIVDITITTVEIRGPPLGLISVETVTFTRLASGEVFASGDGISFTLGTDPAQLSVTDASFALYLKPDGTSAFSVTGDVDATFGDVQIDGTITVERNTTSFDVDLATADGEPIDLAIAAGITRITGSLHVDVDGVAEMDADVTIIIQHVDPNAIPNDADDVDEILIGATNVEIRVGSWEEEDFSDFVGFHVVGADLVLLISSADGSAGVGQGSIALDVRGTVTLDGVTGVTVGGRMGVQVSTFDVDVLRTVEVAGTTLTLDVATGVTQFSGDDVELTVAGQTLSGTFSVTIADQGNSDPADDVITIELSDVTFSVGDGTRPFLSVTNGTGTITKNASGFVGDIEGDVVVDIPGFDIDGHVAVRVAKTTTENAISFQIGTVGDKADVTIGGQTLAGVFTFEQTTHPDFGTIVKVGATEVDLDVGGGIATITGGTAALLILPTGVAGAFEGEATLALPTGMTFTSGDVVVRINTTATEITNVTFDFDGTIGNSDDVELDLPAGPYLRVDVTNAVFELEAMGLTLSAGGNLSIEQQTLSNGTTVTTIGFTGVHFEISLPDGGPSGEVTNAEGAFVVLPTGVAGILSGNFDADLGPVAAGGFVTVRFNATPGLVEETVEVDGREITISFGPDEGDSVELSVSGASLNIGDFVTIEGDVTIDTTSGLFAGTNLEVFLGKGPARLDDDSINPLAVGVLLTNATVGVVRRGTGPNFTYAVFATGTLQIIGVNGVTVVGTATVRFNNTGSAVNEIIAIEAADTDVVVNVPNNTAVVEAIGLQISVFGQTLGGDFTFTKSGFAVGTPSTDPGTLEVHVENLTLHLGGVVSLTNGE
ncbi:MAG TPA: hypothetical protein VGK49_05795, partial [Ilumatobacteraceae bacterium]